MREQGDVAEADADRVRLSLPADDDLCRVIEVAVGVLARRWGLSDDEVSAARAAAGEAFTDLAGGGAPGEVEVVVEAAPHHIEILMSCGTATRLLEAPPG